MTTGIWRDRTNRRELDFEGVISVTRNAAEGKSKRKWKTSPLNVATWPQCSLITYLRKTYLVYRDKNDQCSHLRGCGRRYFAMKRNCQKSGISMNAGIKVVVSSASILELLAGCIMQNVNAIIVKYSSTRLYAKEGMDNKKADPVPLKGSASDAIRMSKRTLKRENSNHSKRYYERFSSRVCRLLKRSRFTSANERLDCVGMEIDSGIEIKYHQSQHCQDCTIS